MIPHPTEGALHRYHDGEVTEHERAEIETHLHECQSCAAVYREIRELTDRLRALPAAVDPPRNLWPGILGQLGDPSAVSPIEIRAWRSARLRALSRVGRGSLAAAAVLVIGVGLGLWLDDGSRNPIPVAGAPAAGPSRLISDELGYDATITEMEAALEEMRDELQPETTAIIEENLAIIDAAIREANAALQADPANEHLLRHLAAQRQMKLRVLRMVTQTVAANF